MGIDRGISRDTGKFDLNCAAGNAANTHPYAPRFQPSFRRHFGPNMCAKGKKKRRPEESKKRPKRAKRQLIAFACASRLPRPLRVAWLSEPQHYTLSREHTCVEACHLRLGARFNTAAQRVVLHYISTFMSKMFAQPLRSDTVPPPTATINTVFLEYALRQVGNPRQHDSTVTTQLFCFAFVYIDK